MKRRRVLWASAGLAVSVVLGLMLFESKASAIVVRRGCERECYLDYIDQLDYCLQLYCPDPDHCDEMRLSACMTMARRMYFECLRACK